jgi:hypothetical protein
MRLLASTLALVLLASAASAQVTVELLLDEPEYLRDESMVVRVRVTNRSGRPLQLGQSNDWLSFSIQAADGTSVLRLEDPPVAGAFTIASAQSGTKSVNLMPCFDFPGPGRYTVSASVRIPQWEGEVISPPKPFHIIRGSKLLEEEFGVPAPAGPPEMRKYSLVRANGLKQQRLYVRVTDAADQKVFRVVPLGPMVSFGRPEARVDAASVLHLVFQNGPRSFLYGAISPEGVWQSRLTFDYGETRPSLRVTEQGRVVVSGGVRRVTPADIPAPAPAVPADGNPPPPPPLKDAPDRKP